MEFEYYLKLLVRKNDRGLQKRKEYDKLYECENKNLGRGKI